MKRERIFIIPTRFGWIYFAGTMVCLLAGTIYTNNLVYLLTFFLVALVLIGMVQTHANMKGIFVEKMASELIEENAYGQGVLWLRSQNLENHQQIRVELEEKGEVFENNYEKLSAKALQPMPVSLFGRSIGIHHIRKIRVSTIYPFGMFYSCKTFKVDFQYVVYPKPSGSFRLPEPVQGSENYSLVSGQNGDDFTQHREYVIGESQRHVDWKAYARGRPLLVKEFKDGEKSTCLLEYEATKGTNEERLRQLSLWVNLCTTKNERFALYLKDQKIPSGSGRSHRNKCLRALAELGNHHD